ncbi:MAG: class I SAM-dependent methyltransferase [Methylobacter sp.]
MKIKQAIPWRIKIGVKILLSRLPIHYEIWKRIGLFEHGDMNQPSRAFETFVLHATSANLLVKGSSDNKLLHLKKPPNGEFSVLELGPGDSLFTALIAKTLGATRSWLVDAGPYAINDHKAYVKMADYLREMGYMPSNDLSATTLEEILSVCNAEYLTEGTHSLSLIPDHSVDYCFSNAVLEHVPKDEFKKLIHEMQRILKPDGVCLHRVDLKDHLGGGLNNLRFSESTWESEFFRKSGFYTNRVRFTEMVTLFQQADFECQLPLVIRWNRLPISRSALAEIYRELPDDDLLVSGFDVILKHRQ